MDEYEKMVTYFRGLSRQIDEAFVPIRSELDKVFQTIGTHMEVIERNLVQINQIFEALSSIDVDKLNEELYHHLSSNGWAITLETSLIDMLEIADYEKQGEVDEQRLLEVLYGMFEETEANLEENLCNLIGDNNKVFVKKQFILMRLGYRVNSIPILIILIEKVIKKLSNKDGDMVKPSEVTPLLEKHISSIISDETEDESKQILIKTYINAFENNIKIVEKTFVYYDTKKPHRNKPIEDMGIINRNQVFHTAKDLDEANEIHFYKLYFILIFLLEVHTLEQTLKEGIE